MVYTIHLQVQMDILQGQGPLDGTQAKIDWTKDSEYIRLYGKEGNKKSLA